VAPATARRRRRSPAGLRSPRCCWRCRRRHGRALDPSHRGESPAIESSADSPGAIAGPWLARIVDVNRSDRLASCVA
jgi:hypothetical protein